MRGDSSKATPYMGILFALSITHCCNDTLQGVLTSLYPIIKSDLALDFIQIGIITLIYQMSASILQPLFGLVLDKRPRPYMLTVAALFTFTGLIALAYANTFLLAILSVIFVGVGSSIVHPEASRLTSLASAGRKGFAQSVFQVGGNLGSSIGPLLAAFVIAPYGRQNTVYATAFSIIGIIASIFIARWYKKILEKRGVDTSVKKKIAKKGDADWIERPFSDKTTYRAIVVLLLLIFSKYVYLSSLTSFYTFYTIDKFGLTVQQSQYALFVFIFATALGTMFGGPIGDKIGRKYVIWFSILGTSPFALLMPYMPLGWTIAFSFMAGFILSSAFPAIVIYAQELLPNRIGMISGLFFGFAFGIAGVASAFWGGVAEHHGVETVFKYSAYLPLLGIVAVFLPQKHN